MASEFRYLLACREVENDGGLLTLKDVADTVNMPRVDFPCELKMTVVVGVRLERPAWNKSLELQTWRIGEHQGEKAVLVPVKTTLFLPRVEGFTSVSFLTLVSVAAPGDYGFDLLDQDGVFGTSDEVIASFSFGIDSLD